MIAYIIAGAIAFFHLPTLMAMFSHREFTVPLGCNLTMAFVGGVAGHLLFTLLNS